MHKYRSNYSKVHTSTVSIQYFLLQCTVEFGFIQLKVAGTPFFTDFDEALKLTRVT